MIVLNAPGIGDLKISELVDAEEFGDMVGVQRLTIHAYRKQPDKYGIPEPALWAAGAPLWTRDQVEDWKADRAGQGVGGGRSSWRTAVGE